MMLRGGLLKELDRYFDAAPRTDAETEGIGPFVLFVGRGAWTYYARPQLGLAEAVSLTDIADLEQRCVERGVGLGIEWVGEVTPSLESVARQAGLTVERHALLVLAPDELLAQDPPAGVVVELLEGADQRLDAARAVAEVAFAAGGTTVGSEGVAEREQQTALLAAEMRAHLAQRSIDQLTLTAVAIGDQGVLASGSLQPAGDAGEILAVATLPCARRRGLAAAVTSALVVEAKRRELRVVLLSAQDDDVARVYERVGFRRVGTHLAAER